MSGIFYDAQGAQTPHHPERGIARYVTELGVALGRVAPGLVDAVLYDPELPLTAPFDRLAATAPLRPNDHASVGAARVYHVGSPFELGRPGAALWPQPARRAGARVVVTLYDLIPLLQPVDYLPSPFERVLYRRSLELVRAADALVAISQASADDGHRLLGIPTSRLHVIGAGANDEFTRPERPLDEVQDALTRTIPSVRPGYVFLPTGMDARKNWDVALDAYARLRRSLRAAHQLVVTCRLDETQEATVRARAARLGIADDVVLTGVVDDPTLVRMYQAATVVLFPSRYEGFGLPPLEARLCGAPVICGDNSSLREVITDPSARFDADDVAAVAASLERVLTDETHRRRLTDAPLPPFTWERSARATAAVYERLARRPPRSGPVVAVVGDVDDGALAGRTAVRRFGHGEHGLLRAADRAGALRTVLYVAGANGLDGATERLRHDHAGELVDPSDLGARLDDLSLGATT